MKKLFFLLVMTSTLLGKPTICLNMIVKDEAHVIERCLSSVKPMIDHWIIVDTGSTDGTQKIIKKFMKGIPGELHERPWVDFATNRNQALKLAKGKADYIFFIDADDYLDCQDFSIFDNLTLDYYLVPIQFNLMQYQRPQLIRSSLTWEWKGVVHEQLQGSPKYQGCLLEGVKVIASHDGSRSSDPDKIFKDIAALEAALKKEPHNPHYLYYLGASYAAVELFDKGIEFFEKRMNHPDRSSEVFLAMYHRATLMELQGYPFQEVVQAYSQTYEQDPRHVAPLLRLSRFLAKNEMYYLGYLVAKKGSGIPFNPELILTEPWMFNWGIKFEQSVCAYWIGRYEESLKLSEEILSIPSLPDEVRETVKYNISCCKNHCSKPL